MKVYNLEIFDIPAGAYTSGLETIYFNVYHRQIGNFKYSFDYYDKEKNVLELPRTDLISLRNIVRITDALDNSIEYLGQVDSIEYDGDKMKVTYTDFFSEMLDTNVIFDTNRQGTTETDPLEIYLGSLMEQVFNETHYWSSGRGQNIVVSIDTEDVIPYGFNIKPDYEGTHWAIVNLKKVLINRALTEYSVAINSTFNYFFTLNVGKISDNYEYIETNAPYVISSTVKTETNERSVNRLFVYDVTTNQSKFFWLRNDGEVIVGRPDDEYADGAVQPPIFADSLIQTQEGDSFIAKATEDANAKMKQDPLNMYISIEVSQDNEMFRRWKIGQRVRVIHNGKEIPTILTGIKIDNTYTLIFGALRLDLTKKLARR